MRYPVPSYARSVSLTFDQFRELVKDRVRELNEMLAHPDATWPGVLFAEDGQGEVSVAFLIDLTDMSAPAKQALATVILPERIRGAGARRVCWLMPAWIEEASRIECLVLIFLDGQRREAAFARVIRRPRRPPRLASFTASPRSTPLRRLDGLFVDPLAAALEPAA